MRDEITIGQQANQQVRREVPVVSDRVVADYVRTLGRALAARAPGPKYPYSFTVANYRDLNAFALPGGPVWIHRGALQAARSEAQIVGVIAHEVAHVALRHAADQLTKGMVANGLLGVLGAVLGNDNGAQAARLGAGLLANGVFLRFSRDDELEADRVGATIASRAGFDPNGLVEFLQVLRQEQGRDPSKVDVFLSTHPSPRNRIQRLRQEIRTLRRGTRSTGRFAAVKQRLSRLAPAPAAPRR